MIGRRGSGPPKPGQPGFSGFPVFQLPRTGSKVLGYKLQGWFGRGRRMELMFIKISE